MMNHAAAYERVAGGSMAGKPYIGTIESVDDDRYIGRCKIRVFGVFGPTTGGIPTEHLPYAYPGNGLSFGDNGSGELKQPKVGTVVRVRFDGDIYHPIYESIEEIESGLNNLAASDYTNFMSIAHLSDIGLKIYYTEGSGLVIDNKGSIINIANDNSITITHAGSESVIELRGPNVDVVSNDTVSTSSSNQILENSNYIHINGVRVDIGGNPIYSAVLYQPLLLLIKQMAAIIDQKLPLSPGVTASLVESMQELFKSNSIQVSK